MLFSYIYMFVYFVIDLKRKQNESNQLTNIEKNSIYL
jgi:hypothetical protein